VLTIWGQKVPVGLRADTTTTITNTWSPSGNFLTKTLGPDKLSICHYPLPTTNPDLPCCPPRDFPPFHLSILSTASRTRSTAVVLRA
jgi:hypothetical protein